MTQVSPLAQASSSAPASSWPLERLPGRAVHHLLPPPTPQGAFLSFGPEPRGCGGWSSHGARAPHQWPVPPLLLAVPTTGFSLIPSDVQMPEHCGCCRAGGWHSPELSSRDTVECKGGTGVCWAWEWGTGTALGPTWDEAGEAVVRHAVSQSPASPAGSAGHCSRVKRSSPQ